MKFNWKPARTAFIDFEVESRVDLPNSTHRKYFEHPSTRALTCVVIADGRTSCMGPYLGPEDLEYLSKLAATHTLVAHNAPFDAAVWVKLGLPEAEWFDTLPCARKAGFPGGLDQVSKLCGGRGKDKNGDRLIDMLCKLKDKPVAIGPAHSLLMAYNRQDVEELALVYSRVKDFVESDVMTLDRKINDRGIPADRKLLEALLEMYAENAELSEEKFIEHTRCDKYPDGINPRSSKQMQDWFELNSFGGMRKFDKAAVNELFGAPQEFFTGDEDCDEAAAFEHAREAIELRRECVGVGRGKAKNAAMLLDSDDRIRDVLIYYGAHLGRWTSRKLQVHNMPSVLKGMDIREVEPSIAAVREAARECGERTGQRVTVSDTLNLFLRRLVAGGRKSTVDYSQVEARMAAYIAREDRMLKPFGDPHGPSVYLDMGEQIFRRRISKKDDPMQYTLAKSVVLGAMYGMSGAKFKKQIAVRESRATVKAFEDAGIDMLDVIRTYRKTYPRIPQLWRELNDAALSAVRGVSCEAGRCFFGMVGPDLHLVLMSGRPIVYRNARIEKQIPAYVRLYNMPEQWVDTVVFDSPRGRGFLYGSKICENICQGACRDMLAGAMVNLDQLSYEVPIHVHDEACALDERLDLMLEVMSEPPPWAPDFPLMVEGCLGDQWSKATSGYIEKAAFMGRVL